jgi:hypothetical protein
MDRYLKTMNRAVRASGGRALRRGLPLFALVVALFSLAGDRGVRSATSSGQDPLSLLDLQVKPNLAILIDTSGSMSFTTLNTPGFVRDAVGGDDPRSRLYQIKDAVDAVVAANSGTINFGLLTFAVRPRDKQLNKTNNFYGQSGWTSRYDGPLVYVSRDTAAALFAFYNADGDSNLYETTAYTGATSGGDLFTCSGNSNQATPGFFCDINNTSTNYNTNPPPPVTAPTTTQSQAIYESFGNTGVHSLPYPVSGNWQQPTNPATVTLTVPQVTTGCPEGTPTGSWKCLPRVPVCTLGGTLLPDNTTNPVTPPTGCIFFMESRVLRSGVKYTWNRASTSYGTRLTRIDAITCPLPPNGLVGNNPDNNGDGLADNPVPCFQFADSATGQIATYYYTSAVWQTRSGTGVPGSCDGSATIANVVACDQTTPQVVFDALRAELPVNANGTLPDLTANQNPAPNLLAGVSAGVPTTQPDPGLGNVGVRADGSTPIAKSLASMRTVTPAIFPAQPTGLPTGAVQRNFVLILTDGNDTCDSPQLAAQRASELYYQGGFSPTNMPGTDSRHQAETLVIAFTDGADAASADLISQAGSGGTSTNSFTSVTCPAGVPCRPAFTAANLDDLKKALSDAISLVTSSGSFADRTVLGSVYEYGGAPLDPVERYRTFRALLVSSTWAMPGFQGHLMGFANLSGAAALQWDAGQKILASVDNTLTTTPQPFTALPTLIHRRIYTTAGNGSNTNYTATNLATMSSALAWTRTSLWPPPSTVDPAVGGTGTFDTELGLPTYSFTDLQGKFGACMAASTYTWPGGHPCQTSGTTQLNAARKEAREMILAFMAGAAVAKSGGYPSRNTSTGDVLYSKRDWILADGTSATPAIAAPPPSGTASIHSAEYLLYTNGPRDAGGHAGNGVLAGLGLAAPDADGSAGSAADQSLKPVMTVVYHAANDMLHAFRGGPCPALCTGETGGEELWGFVPYDELGKLTTRLLTPQTRSNHTYMMAAPVRIADVFVPAGSGGWTGTFSGVSASGTGVWRLMLLVGRGPGGKYLTALDVTAPGPTTTASLSTAPPIPVWNRTYSGMGETWSIPAVGPVNQDLFIDSVTGAKVEFVAFVGSGYSDVTSEGTTFYALNVLNGNVIAQYDVGQGTSAFQNALVAGPSLFQPNLLTFATCSGCIPIASTDPVTYVYFPDLHGRVFRFDTASPGTAPMQFANYGAGQPFGVGAALMNMNTDVTVKKPHVFVAAGDDTRVGDNNSLFKMIGLRDSSGVAAEVFAPLNFDAGYRGTVHPVGAFDTDGIGLLMFVGTKFTPAQTLCISRFDSEAFIVEARNGLAAYNLPDNGGRSIGFANTKITDATWAGGSPRVTGGLHPEAPQPPPAQSGAQDPTPTVSVGPPIDPNPSNPSHTFPPFPGTTGFKVGSTVCR